MITQNLTVFIGSSAISLSPKAAPTTEVSAAKSSFMELTDYSGFAFIISAYSLHPTVAL